MTAVFAILSPKGNLLAWVDSTCQSDADRIAESYDVVFGGPCQAIPKEEYVKQQRVATIQRLLTKTGKP